MTQRIMINKLINKINKLSFTYTIALPVIVLALSACSQTPVRPSTVIPQNTKDQNLSVTEEEREEYRGGLTALSNNNYSKAQYIFNEFIQNKPDMAGAYSNLALIYFKKEKYDQSLELINKALERNPDQAQAYQLRAQLLVIKGKIHEARNDYIKAIELKPDYINAQYNLALLYDIYLQEIELAIKHYEIYLSLLEKPDERTQEWVGHLKGILRSL